MNLTKKQLIILGGIVLVVIILVLMGLGIIPGLKTGPVTMKPVSLTVWGVEDAVQELQPAVQSFARNHPGATVTYWQFTDTETYHTTLLEALAAGTGPDIFAIRNTEVMRHASKLVAMPKERLSLLTLRNTFAPVVERDFVVNGGVVALPLSIDTLSLIYNRDHFNEAGIVSAPATWDDLVAIAPRLSVVDDSRRVTRASIALGGSGSTIPRVSDIISALMLQGGIVPVGPDWGGAGFATRAGYDAVNFYLQFSNTGSPLYTWNEGMPNAVDAFAQGRVAMIIDYARALPDIRERNPLMNFAVAPLPQQKGAERSKTMASYWGYTVSRQSKQARLAWDFIVETATNPQVVSAYLNASKRPPAIPKFIEAYRDNPNLAVFAQQTLTADSWPMPNRDLVGGIFSDMVTTVLENRASVETAVGRAQSDISRLIGSRPR
ncbi:MAG: extracellular solute-binding protein [bacterium]|nr:extracellular solute-binding protein [bacterium]